MTSARVDSWDRASIICFLITTGDLGSLNVSNVSMIINYSYTFCVSVCFAHTERTWQINNIDIDRSNILNSNVLSLSLPFRESCESQSELWVWTGEQREQEGMVTSDEASRSVEIWNHQNRCRILSPGQRSNYIIYTSSNKWSYVSDKPRSMWDAANIWHSTHIDIHQQYLQSLSWFLNALESLSVDSGFLSGAPLLEGFVYLWIQIDIATPPCKT